MQMSMSGIRYLNTQPLLPASPREGRLNGHDDITSPQDERTALLCACRYGHGQVAEFLVNTCGADMEVMDKEGKTALDYAVAKGFKDVLVYNS